MRNKISNTICGCDYVPEEGDLFYRFVQDKNIKENVDFSKVSGTFIKGFDLYKYISDRVFSREIKSGAIETYVSMLWNDNDNVQNNIEDCLDYLKENGVPLKENSQLLRLT